MSRYIDADLLLEKAGWVNLYIGHSAHVVFSKDIHDAPTVDAVEVVRCKNCGWWDRHTLADKMRGQCHRTGFTMSENGFCSMNKRKESE